MPHRKNGINSGKDVYVVAYLGAQLLPVMVLAGVGL